MSRAGSSVRALVSCQDIAYNAYMSKIRNVVFDLGGVMINYNPRQFIDDLGYHGELGEKLSNAIFMDPVWAQMDSGVFSNYTEALPVFIQHHPQLEKEIRSFFTPDWYEVYTIKRDTERILFDWVYDKGLDIYILSNFSRDGFAYVEKKYPFFKKAKGYVVSAYERLVKPQPEIYRLLLDRFGLKADECVFIDDYPVNIEGARAAGMNGIVFKDPESARQTLIDMGV